VGRCGAQVLLGHAIIPKNNIAQVGPALRLRTVKLMEANMMRLWYVLGCAMALATVLSLTGAPAWARTRGGVTPCELSGVNPAYHKTIFRTAESAAKYGFVKGPDGKWQVIPNCHISS
jgi:hypothetical protein